jgi:hypothetical protein
MTGELHCPRVVARGTGILNALFHQEALYCRAHELSSMRVLDLGSAHYRALHGPEALCFGAFWRLGRARAKGRVGPQGLIGGDRGSVGIRCYVGPLRLPFRRID